MNEHFFVSFLYEICMMALFEIVHVDKLLNCPVHFDSLKCSNACGIFSQQADMLGHDTLF